VATKYYGVKAGRSVGVYKTWNECKAQIDKFKGALYKSFPTEQEAIAYVAGISSVNPANSINCDNPDKVIDIFVDGSFNGQNYSWAFAAYKGNQLIYTDSGVGNDAEAISMRNVAGELAAAVKAIEWGKKEALEAVIIHHDYMGIAAWANGDWKTNNKFTQAYAAFVKPYLSVVRFNKVAGHTGVEGNELVDKLAGEAFAKELAK